MVKVGDIEVVPGFIIAETDLRERFSHSSGPVSYTHLTLPTILLV